MLLNVIIIAVIVCAIIEFGGEAFLGFCSRYVKRHINEETHTAFGNWVFSQYKSDYIEALKKGEAF